MNQEFYIYLLPAAVIGTIIIWFYLNKCKKSNLASTSKDTITGLPDRASFEKDFEEILMNLKGGEKAVLLNIDIKKFSKFNDSLGFDVGELLLEEIGIRLRNFKKKQVKVYRFMCNEFTMIIQRPLDEIEESIKLCENITDVLNKSYDINGYQLNVTISIGIAIYPVDGDNIQILIKNSDIAKRRVNNFTKERYLFYSSGMKEAVFEELIIENSLENAIENEELVIYYQPKVNVNTGEIVSAEALLRWNHPSFGIISPAKFIPLAESTGQIIDIGEWVVTKVCKQIEVWKKNKVCDIPISINISPVQLSHGNIINIIKKNLNITNLDANYLDFEITETAIMQNPDLNIQKLNSLKSIGVNLSLVHILH